MSTWVTGSSGLIVFLFFLKQVYVGHRKLDGAATDFTPLRRAVVSFLSRNSVLFLSLSLFSLPLPPSLSLPLFSLSLSHTWFHRCVAHDHLATPSNT